MNCALVSLISNCGFTTESLSPQQMTTHFPWLRGSTPEFRPAQRAATLFLTRLALMLPPRSSPYGSRRRGKKPMDKNRPRPRAPPDTCTSIPASAWVT